MVKKVFVFDHPLIKHKIAILRAITTNHKLFRELVNEIALLMGYEATRYLPLAKINVETPLGIAKSETVSCKVCLIPILRAGLSMVEGVLQLIPTAKVGHIGLYRDTNQLPIKYYCKFPSDIADSEVLLLDPMLATGGSASDAIQLAKDAGAKKIKLLSVIAATIGISKVNIDHPDVDIFIAAEDSQLNDHGYIIPGLGDAGDRLYGTM